MKIASEVTFILLFTLSSMTQAQPLLLNEIIAIHKNPSIRAPEINVTQELQRYVPIGSKVDDAMSTLKDNEFWIKMETRNGIRYLMGGKEIERHFVGYVEIRVTMTIVDGRITTSKGSIFRHTI